MSWLSNLTGNKPPLTLPPTIDDTGDSSNPPSTNKPGDKNQTKQVPSVSQWSNFDPTGLERAAKAAKDLENSRHARDALDLARVQENTKQQEYKSKLKEREAYMEQLKIEKVKVEYEEKRRTLDSETQQYKQRANYQDQLSRKRNDDQLSKQQKMNEQNIARQEESVKKQEAMRKATIDYKARLRKENDMAVAAAKVKAQGQMRRENRDIETEAVRTKLAEYRKTILDIVKTSSNIIGTGFSSLINNPYQISVLCGTILGLSFGLKSIKASVQLMSSYLESRLGKPSLIRETSRFNRRDLPKQFVGRFLSTKTNNEEKVMRGIFLDKIIEDQLIRISISSINTKKNNGYYRNLLFYGPPGTGKTLFAKSMAHTVGMDYAIMTGGDVAPLGKDAVTAIHNVFKWASTSKKGLLLFIDEADAFLKKRNKETISEDMRNALNAFLYNTGESSKNFMLVLATNQPSQLDRAINDRVDELVEFTLPKEIERKRLLKYYFNKCVKEEKSIKIEQCIIDDEESLIDKLTTITSGLSGRELSKLAISWQASAFASIDGVLTMKMIMDRANELAFQHQLKIDWEKSPGSCELSTNTVDYLGHQRI